MKIVLRLFFGLVVIPGSIAALLFHLNRHGFFDLDRIDIVLVEAPANSLHLKPLVAQLDQALEAYRGQSLWSLKLEEISGKIGRLNWAEEHSVARSWPSTLTIKIRPYEVKAIFLESKDRFIPVIREGKLLDPVDPSLAPDVAVLEGAQFQSHVDLRKKAVAFLDEVPKEGAFSRRTISEVHWDAKEGFLVKMMKSGIDVRIGEDHFGLKSIRAGQVLEYLENRGVAAKSLDANLSKKVLVKLKEPSQSGLIE